MTEIAGSRPSAAGWGVGEVAVALVGLAWIALAAFWAAPGVFIVDGFVYHAMIDAFARDGSLFVQNGLEEYGSEALKLHLMREADGRLAPQYPGGWGILAVPAYLAGGIRGVILVNAVASALTLAMIWQAARALFDDRHLATTAALIYGLASFAVDYALGFWPHGMSTFLVTAAIAAIATGWRGSPAAELRGALIAGLLLGLAVNIRVDTLFAVAPLGLWLLVAGRRPYPAAGLLVAGLLPGLAVATAINQMKFGIPSPVSYGRPLGDISRLAPLVLVGMVAALLLGLQRVRAALYTPAGVAAAAIAGLVILLAIPSQRELLLRLAEGFWVRVIDFQAHPAPALGLTEIPDGTIRMYGRVKKAFLQSLPYAPVLIVLLPRLWHGSDRGPVGLCILFAAIVMAPFLFIGWHGGMGNNMRYFLNITPVVAILSALALRDIGRMSREGGGVLAFACAAGVGGAGLFYGAARDYPWVFTFQNTLPNTVAAAAAALALMVVLTRGALRGTIAEMLRGVAVLGLLTAFLLGWLIDVQFTNVVRARNSELATLSAQLPRDALVATYTPDTAGLRVNRPPALTGQANHRTLEIDPPLAALVERGFAEGRPVFAQGRHLAERMLEKGIAGGLAPRFGYHEKFEFYEMSPPAGDRGEAG